MQQYLHPQILNLFYFLHGILSDCIIRTDHGTIGNHRKYHRLTQIEDQFRIMKSDLETRPIFVRTKEHIEAHLTICMIALIIIRIIQKRIIQSGLVEIDSEAYWNTGLNAHRIQEALNKWKVDLLPGDYYRFMDVDDPDLKLILEAFEIRIPAKLYQRGELKNIKTQLEIFK